MISLLVRSPLAPKITMAQGGGGAGGWRDHLRCVVFFAVLGLRAVPSTWPPNSLRMADSSFSPKVWSLRERKRA